MVLPRSSSAADAPTGGLSRSAVPVFLVGVPAALGVLCFIYLGPLRHTVARRYVTHPVECVEVIMFCCAAAAFGFKFLRSRVENSALRAEILPAWDGRPVPVSDARGLLRHLDSLPPALRGSIVVRRVAAVLQFLIGRGSALGLDDQLRALADNDALTLESSYSLTRFITWAIPILGFLGTVLGITQAISGVTPEVLEQSLGNVTDGLALAFDTTALGLGLTMITMFLSFLVEHAEQGNLETVDRFADRELAHRFTRPDNQGAGADVAHENAAMIAKATSALLQRQTEAWAQAQADVERQRAELGTRLQQQLTKALETALEKTLNAHGERLTVLEKQAADMGKGAVEKVAAQAVLVCDAGRDQQAALAKVIQGISAQSQTLLRLHESEKDIIRLQRTLDQNLAALAGAGAFEQAVHSLNAAIHLLTSRLGSVSVPADPGRSGRPGVAA